MYFYSLHDVDKATKQLIEAEDLSTGYSRKAPCVRLEGKFRYLGIVDYNWLCDYVEEKVFADRYRSDVYEYFEKELKNRKFSIVDDLSAYDSRLHANIPLVRAILDEAFDLALKWAQDLEYEEERRQRRAERNIIRFNN